PFGKFPAVILSSGRTCCLKINFLKIILSHIADVKITGQTIEGEAPRIPQSVRPDFRLVTDNSSKWIACWHGIGRYAALDIDEQNFSQNRIGILAEVLRISFRPAITHANI